MNLAENDRFQHEKCIKTQNFKRSKIDINLNHLQDLKNIKNPIFNDSSINFAQNHILKKKSCQMPKKTENPRFFEFHKSIKWQGMARIGR